MINRAKLRGKKLDEDCKFANTTTEADLCVCGATGVMKNHLRVELGSGAISTFVK